MSRESISRREFLKVAGITAAGGIMAACAPPMTPASETSVAPTAALAKEKLAVPQQLVIRVALEGFSLDPARTTGGEDWTVMQQTYNALLRFKPGTFELEPDLATKWDRSSDGLAYTFELRKDVKFHRGFGTLTAEDVKFSLDRLKDPATSVYAGEVEAIDRVEILSENSLRVVLKKPAPDLLYKVSTQRPFTGYVVSKKAAMQYGKDFGNNPIGTGPFMLKSRIPRDRYVLEPNPDYFEGPPKLSKVTVLIMPDEPTMALAVEAGEVHIGEAQSDETRKRYLNDPNASIVRVSRVFGSWLVLNKLVKPLDDVRVRRAIAYAIDYDAIVNGLLGGFAVQAGAGLLHPGMTGYDASVNQPVKHDVDEAKKLLAEAGYGGGLKLTMVSYTTTIYRQLGELLQAQLKEAGISLEVQNLERAVLMEARVKETTPVIFFASSDVPDPNPWLNMIDPAFIPPNGYNMARYSGMTELITQAKTEADPAKRNELLRQVQKKFSEDLPLIPLYHPQATFLVHKSVKDYIPEAVGGTGCLKNTYLA